MNSHCLHLQRYSTNSDTNNAGLHKSDAKMQCQHILFANLYTFVTAAKTMPHQSCITI